MACARHNSFLLTGVPSDRRGRTVWLTRALSQFFLYSALKTAVLPHSQTNNDWVSFLTTEQPLSSSPSSVMESSGVLESKYCTGMSRPSMVLAAIPLAPCSGSYMELLVRGASSFHRASSFQRQKEFPGLLCGIFILGCLWGFHGIFNLMSKVN